RVDKLRRPHPRSAIASPRAPYASALLLLALCALPACGKRDERVDLTEWIWIDPGPAVVRLPGPKASVRVLVRNLREQPLHHLRLAVESPACEAVVHPAALPLLGPGDRTTFALELTRRPKLAEPRYPFELTLRADELPVAAGLDLSVDLTQAKDEGWIEVGQVKIVNRSGAKSVPYLLAALPLAVLAGWLLYRVTRRRRERKPR
ncbi:MAG: hypothetical protein IT371_06870, partial [Deltaproteobacteria bacterium]|nr:hypothetical protein [Deltaproteobacteria bacterium]